MAIIPTPRAHMSKHCGVFAPHHRLCEQIILRPEIKKGFFLDDKTDESKRVTRSVLFMRTPIEVFTGYKKGDTLISEDGDEFIDSDDMLTTLRVNFELNESGRPTIVY